MKKIIALLLSVQIITLAGCTEKALESGGTSKSGDTPDQKSTYARVGTLGRMMGHWGHIYTLQEAAEEADLIADVTIIAWHAESTEREKENKGRYTYFTAKINNTVKGDEYSTIILAQNGDSEFTNSDDPLYKIGDRLFVFLGEMPYEETRKRIEAGEDAEPYDIEYEDAFYSLGFYQTVFNVFEYESETYLLTRYGGGAVRSMGNIEKADSKILESIVDAYIKSDPLIGELIKEEELRYTLGYAFVYDSVLERIAKFLKMEDTQ